MGLPGAVAWPQSRIYVTALVNDQPVRMEFDTCCESSVLLRRTARRLGLKVTDPPPGSQPSPGKAPASLTEECRCSLSGRTVRGRFHVIDIPEYVDPECDGVLAWSSVAENVLRIDARRGKLFVAAAVPTEVTTWQRCSLHSGSGQLGLRLPAEPGDPGVVYVDTGSCFGVHLGAPRWQRWRAKHPREPATLAAYWTPADGLLVATEMWADRLAFGPMVLADVPVTSAAPCEGHMEQHVAMLGLAALARLNLIVDGKNRLAYFRSIPGPAPPYGHNRIGAVFVPGGTAGEELVAHVLDGSPAHEAGVRRGDVLLAIRDLDVTQWRTDPRVLPLSRFWQGLAGTRLKLSLKRAGAPLEATVELRDILGPSPAFGESPPTDGAAATTVSGVARELELPKDGGGTIRLLVKETPLIRGYLPDKVGFTEPSPDNRHVVYVVKRGEAHLVPVLDGMEGKAIEGVLEGKPVFGPDSRRVAYLVKRGEERIAVVDGEGRKEYKAAEKGTPIPASSGKPAFRVENSGDNWYLVRERKPPGSHFVSPDGKRKAREVRRDGKACIAIDGVEGRLYKWVYQPICGSYFCFSPDSKRTAYTAQRDEQSGWVAVVDGVEGPEYTLARDIVFSPDSKHVAYQARAYRTGKEKWTGPQYLVVDGAEVPVPGYFLRCRHMITFDGPTSLHALVGSKAGVSLVEVEIRAE